MPRDLVIGADSSTSATKVIVFGRDGRIVAAASQSYPCTSPRPGWVEQDPADWWRAFAAAAREVMRHPEVKAERLAGLGITHQRFTFVPVDADLRPLRPALLWNDIRCGEEAAEAAGGAGAKQEIFRRTGYAPGPWTLYKALWLKRHEPAVYDRTCKLMLVQDYLLHRLCGRLVTLAGAATMTGALDIAQPDRWATDVIERVGVRRDIWIEPILPGGTVVGGISAAAARETGLPPGLPVVTTAGDQPCGTLGAGMVHAGELGINGGTSCTNEFLAEGLPARRDCDYVIEISPGGDYIVENYIASGGSALLNWYRRNFGRAEELSAAEQGREPWELIYSLCAEAPTGNRGVIVLPFFQGANGPYWDLDARGTIYGLHTDCGRPQLVRGLIEGLAYESRRQATLMEAGTGTRLQQIRMYGGSARSDHWNQIFADVFGKPLIVPSTEEATALGAAIAATVGVGLADGFAAATRRMVGTDRAYQPDPARHDIYRRYYDEGYLQLYESLSGHMHRVAAVNRALEVAG